MIAGTRVHNVLDERFASLRDANQLALILYLTAGYPDVESSLHLPSVLVESGASIIELGVPFSDPLGDGPTIQRSSQQALANGMSLRGSLRLASSIAAQSSTPIVLMSYCNPLFRMGSATFAHEAAAAGVSGVIVPDLPIEESDALAADLAAAGVHLIYLLSPASTEDRIARTARSATGFIYCMALTGVTGARDSLAAGLPDFLRRVRALTDVPLVVGFGVSRPEHIRQLAAHTDGVIVASALLDLIDRTSPELRDVAVAAYVRELRASCSAS